MVATAPYKLDKSTPEQSYKEGFKTGQTWDRPRRPGGPWVPVVDRFSTDADWNEYCVRKAECNRTWLRGFDAAALSLPSD